MLLQIFFSLIRTAGQFLCKPLACVKIGALWLVTILPCVAYAGVPEHIRFEALLEREGITLGYIGVILQDQDGFIWLGGEGGLIRYDGYRFKVYSNLANDKSSIGGNTVLALVEDRHRNLWVGTDDGGLNRYNRQTDNFTRFDVIPDGVISLSAGRSVRGLLFDHSGRLLVNVTGYGVVVYDPQNTSFKPLMLQEGGTPVGGHFGWKMFEDSQKMLWVGTEREGVIRYDFERGSAQTYGISSAPGFRLDTNTVRSIFEDSRGSIWLGTDAGLYRLDESGKVDRRWHKKGIETEALSSDIIWDIFEDQRGDLWIGTDGGGVNILDAQSHRVQHFVHDPYNPHSISSNVVRDIMEDRNGDIWTGNYPSGVNVFHRAAESVVSISSTGTPEQSLSSPSVLSLLQGNAETVWMGTDGGGLNRLDLRTGKIKHFLAGEQDLDLSAGAVLSLAKNPDGQLWVGTWGGGLHLFDPQKGIFKRFAFHGEEETAPSHKNIWSAMVDLEGILWIGTEGLGINRHDPKTGIFERFPINRALPYHAYAKVFERGESGWGLVNGFVWSIVQGRDGKVWFGTSRGLTGYDKRKDTFTHYFHDPERPSSLRDDTVLDIYEDSRGWLWLSTKGGVSYFDGITPSFTHVGRSNGMVSDAVKSVIEGTDEDMWFGTANGLVRYYPKTKKIMNFNQSNWAEGKFNNGASMRLPDGSYVFGRVDGLLQFNPDTLKRNTMPPPVKITGFELFNQEQEPGVMGSPLDKAISETDYLELNYKQSVFSFKYAALNYINTENNQYAYRLEGFDDDWQFVGNKRTATYTNLEAGHYRFHVIGSNDEGVWNEEGQIVDLVVTPAPWLTWWAYCIYSVFIALIIGLYVRAQRKKIEQERAISDRLRHLDRLKDDFLANTSHELRTPLNGIIGLSQSLVDGVSGELSDDVKNNLNIITNCGKRLASLVNDILDFSRLKNRDIKLALRILDLRELVNTVFTMSRSLIGKKDIDLINNVDPKLSLVYADEDRLQQILFNLIGNAIKFTENGSVIVMANQDEGSVWVSIKDTGIGVSEKVKMKIFESFEQAEEHENRRFSGTGLGLTITKQLVEMHGGEIVVESDGKQGAEFRFSLPRPSGYENKMPDVSSRDDTRSQSMPDASTYEVPIPLPLLQESPDYELELRLEDKQRYRILVVDDEEANRHLLISHLTRLHYQVEDAESGSDALHILSQGRSFHLVLLDVMMPRMSGYETCAEIRKQHTMSNLPIIFMTAKNMISDLVDGFDVGANDFLTKPISKGELSSRVRTHLQLQAINRHMESQVQERTDAVEKTHAVLETLDGIVATLNREMRLDKLLEVLLREASSLFPQVNKAMYWSFLQSSSFKLLASRGYDDIVEKAALLSEHEMTTFIGETAFELEGGIYITKRGDVDSNEPNSLRLLSPKPKSALILPIYLDKLMLGYLMLQNFQTTEAFDEIDRGLLGRFYEHVSSALVKARLMEALKTQNHQLENATLTDQQTGLRNRRYLFRCLDSDIALSLRLHRKQDAMQEKINNADLLFFVLDIDALSDINETHGYSAGDKVLHQLKPLMESVFRQSDFLVRWGGEEFLLVGRFSERDAAPMLAERLRHAVSEHIFALPNGEAIRATCSVGYSAFPFVSKAPQSYSWTQVVDVATMCLSAAKKSSKNAWVGLSSADTCEGLSYKDVISQPEAHIKAGKLKLSSSLKDTQRLLW